MAQSSDFPAIKNAEVCFIKTTILPNFITNKIARLDSNFRFLTSVEDYSQYYTEFEIREKSSPVDIPDLGKLKPLRKKHTLHSYWKAYRLRIKETALEGRDLTELYLFLPLIIEFPIRSVKADGKKYPVRIFVYLFPFGACCINMKVTVDKQSLDFNQFIKLISNMRRSTIDQSGSFDRFSLVVARNINKALFKNGDDILSFPTHSLIFIKKTFPYLTYDENVLKEHAYAIAAVMTGKKIDDMIHLTYDAIKDILYCKLKILREEEILFFSRTCTFLHPYRYWKGEEPTPKDVLKRLECMCDNYQSFLNVIFSANRFLNYVISSRSELNNALLVIATKAFNEAFPEITSDANLVNFKHALGPIGKYIGLYDSLKKLSNLYH